MKRNTLPVHRQRRSNVRSCPRAWPLGRAPTRRAGNWSCGLWWIIGQCSIIFFTVLRESSGEDYSSRCIVACMSSWRSVRFSTRDGSQLTIVFYYFDRAFIRLLASAVLPPNHSPTSAMRVVVRPSANLLSNLQPTSAKPFAKALNN